MKLVLDEVRGEEFSNFPESLYVARKALGLNDRFHTFVPCPKCHKLYLKQEVKSFRQDNTTIMKCHHIEFPNSKRYKSRTCNTPLSHQTGSTIRPELEFPYSSIRNQLAIMFRQPNFEDSLCHWVNRQHTDDILTDIYDGQMWKNFKETTDESSSNFFRAEVADSHVGLMLNLDWFQPYEGTIIALVSYTLQFVTCLVIFDLNAKIY